MPIYMQIDGIKGDVKAAGFLGAIELESAQIGSYRSPRAGGGGGPAVNEVVVTYNDNCASPELFQAAATGRKFPTVKIAFVRGNGSAYLKLTLKDAMVSSFNVAGGGTQQRPLVSVTFNFSKIEYEVMKDAQAQNAMNDPDWASVP